MATYLDRIVARHREVAASDTRPLQPLIDAARASAPTRGFRAALAACPHLAVISEVKRRSPSKGDLNIGLDPAALAGEYQRGGASCLSVLTDEEFFGGSVADLQSARAACALPVLRKDFTVCERDVLDARIMGADCVLLIAAALDHAELVGLHQLATDVGLDVLVEIHDEAELEVASACARWMACAAAVYSVSLTSVDLPEPDTPVTQVSRPTGKSTLTFLRLLPLAPTMRMRPSISGKTPSWRPSGERCPLSFK